MDWNNLPGNFLIKSATIEIGRPDSTKYQEIIYQRCKYCKSMFPVHDVVIGFETFNRNKVCPKCSIKPLFKPS